MDFYMLQTLHIQELTPGPWWCKDLAQNSENTSIN